MQLNNGSWLFREETLETIRTLFQRTLGEATVWEAQLLDGGLFNTTYLVTYGAARERAVLRLGPVERWRIMGFEENLMEAEAYLYGICREIGIPCPTVLAWGRDDAATGRDFMITRYIPSVHIEMGGAVCRATDVLGKQMPGNIEGICYGDMFA